MGIYIRKTTLEERATYMREYRAKNKERIKAINKKWWAENKEYRQLKKLL
jgi:2-polyprenyl-3-methyl-5-hydroxy-6-metoxy-1,4-benzoquinol methylase